MTPLPEIDQAARRVEYVRAIALKADAGSFAALFEDFAPRLKSYFLRLGAANAAAEDLAQETMLVVWRKAALFDPARASVSTWIFTIARNLRVDSLRRVRHPSDFEDNIVPEDEPLPYDLLLMDQRRQKIALALRDLSGDQADVIRLSFFEDCAHGEIARRLGIPLGTVKSRLRLAMTRLRTALEGLQ